MERNQFQRDARDKVYYNAVALTYYCKQKQRSYA